MSNNNVQWTHFERYTSGYGSVSRDGDGEWIARVRLTSRKDQQARIRETFTSANAAMSAVIRTWQRENETDKKPVSTKLVKTIEANGHIRLIAEIVDPEQMVTFPVIGQQLDMDITIGDSQIQALYDLLRQAQTERSKKK